ncbi:ATP-binding protein [Rhodococcus erythropolis]|uniref:ATP-binding protein n=1 Tax=Rhodococcus erythropolis TaxID=1833 RepID=UPI001BE6AFCA|nr:NB-ARC domain-containing protein [Rhodococcus erythropolis]MBT2268959.1 hypothetical protein [Rhodococcus erythropolis]
MAQFVRIAKQPVPDLRDCGIADDVILVLERAMAEDPQVRFSAIELGNALREGQRYHRLAVDQMAIQPTPGSALVNTRLDLESRRVPRRIFPVGAKANLPLELTSFVGRRRELTEAKNLLAESRLVTFTGIGGVGKTRLAIRLATSMQGRFVDGVSFAELGELQDEALVVDVVAGALGIRYQSSMLLGEILVQFLAPRELLLVLDSCEHLVAGVAELADVLLRACPRVRILATSREALGIAGEAALLVPPLAIPEREHVPALRSLARYDGVTLFALRAAVAVSSFELTEENRATVVQICHRLDGLPLPIELAAARLRALSLEQILERLTDRYALLARGSRGTPARLQNLRSCVDWSYELCTPDEQLLWSRLSVFAGSMEIDAAEAVCR